MKRSTLIKLWKISAVGLYIWSFILYSQVMFFITAIILLIGLYYVIKFWWNNSMVTKDFSLYNVHIWGAKRRGKDLTTQLAIKRRFKRTYDKRIKELKKSIKNWQELTHEQQQASINIYFYHNPLYLSNVNYGYGGLVIDIKELEIINKKTGKPVLYSDIIDGSYKDMEFEKIDKYEGLDFFLSDVQTGLPNTEHNQLDKLYPWLPVFFALAGQLYNMLIIINSQEFERPWVKLRGQQDKYYRAIKTIPFNKSFVQKYIWNEIPILKNYIFIKVRAYTELQSAQQNMLPFNAMGLVNEGSKHLVLTSGQATKEQFEATYGEIKERTICINKKHIKYDSRIFHQYFYGVTAEQSIQAYNNSLLENEATKTEENDTTEWNDNTHIIYDHEY